MCLIIQKPADVQIPEDILLTAWENNYDGMGIMTTRDNRVKVHRILPNSADDVLNLYNKFKDEEIGIHFRWATHGLINKKMAHPFKVFHNEPKGQDLYMMHNGVFSRVGDWKQGASDTWHFVNEFLQPWLKKYSCEILQEDEFQEMLGSYIGAGNKLLFLDATGKFTTINKKSGAEKDGYWVSNTYSLTPSYRYKSPEIKKPLDFNPYYKSTPPSPMSALPLTPRAEHKFDDEISFAEFNSRELAERYGLDWDQANSDTSLNGAGDIVLLPAPSKSNDNDPIVAKEIDTPERLQDVYDSTVHYLSEGLYAGKTVEELFYMEAKDFWAWFTCHLDLAEELLEDLLVYYMKESE